MSDLSEMSGHFGHQKRVAITATLLLHYLHGLAALTAINQ
jgi:hypothetical protein